MVKLPVAPMLLVRNELIKIVVLDCSAKSLHSQAKLKINTSIQSKHVTSSNSQNMAEQKQEVSMAASSNPRVKLTLHA